MHTWHAIAVLHACKRRSATTGAIYVRLWCRRGTPVDWRAIHVRISGAGERAWRKAAAGGTQRARKHITESLIVPCTILVLADRRTGALASADSCADAKSGQRQCVTAVEWHATAMTITQEPGG